jgi:hypothetical protein
LGFTTDSGHEAAARAVVETVVTVSTAPFGSVVVVVVVVVVVDIVPKGAPRTLDSALTVRASARCMQPQGAGGDACAHLTIICPHDVPCCSSGSHGPLLYSLGFFLWHALSKPLSQPVSATREALSPASRFVCTPHVVVLASPTATIRCTSQSTKLKDLRKRAFATCESQCCNNAMSSRRCARWWAGAHLAYNSTSWP